MITNHYVGRLSQSLSVDDFIENVKAKAVVEKCSLEKFKVEVKNDTLHVFCNRNIADLIRGNNFTSHFRCDAIDESDFPKNKQKKANKKAKKDDEDDEDGD